MMSPKFFGSRSQRVPSPGARLRVGRQTSTYGVTSTGSAHWPGWQNGDCVGMTWQVARPIMRHSGLAGVND
jgi:hypothetical protein